MIASQRSPELEDGSHIRMSQSSGSTGFAQKAFTHCLRAARDRRDVDDFQRDLAMQDIIPGEIGYPRRAAAEFTERAVLASHDLEIAKGQEGWRLISSRRLIEPGSEQTSHAIALRV